MSLSNFLDQTLRGFNSKGQKTAVDCSEPKLFCSSSHPSYFNSQNVLKIQNHNWVHSMVLESSMTSH